MNSKENYWTQPLAFQDLKTFSNQLIKTIGVINTTVKCNGWSIMNVKVTVVEDGHRPIIDRDLFPQISRSHLQNR